MRVSKQQSFLLASQKSSLSLHFLNPQRSWLQIRLLPRITFVAILGTKFQQTMYSINIQCYAYNPGQGYPTLKCRFIQFMVLTVAINRWQSTKFRIDCRLHFVRKLQLTKLQRISGQTKFWYRLHENYPTPIPGSVNPGGQVIISPKCFSLFKRTFSNFISNLYIQI